jgi:hypothetical protein
MGVDDSLIVEFFQLLYRPLLFCPQEFVLAGLEVIDMAIGQFGGHFGNRVAAHSTASASLIVDQSFFVRRSFFYRDPVYGTD